MRLSEHGERLRARVAIGYQPFRRGHQILDAARLALAPARVVPAVSVLAAAAQVRHGKDTARLEPPDTNGAVNVGVTRTPNAPYPDSSVGAAPIGTSPFLCARNIVIAVPSFDWKDTCETSMAAGSKATSGPLQYFSAAAGVARSTRNTVGGWLKLVNVR